MTDGGPAFPIGSGDMRDPMGMTLRDYFAAAAMQAMVIADAEKNCSDKAIAEDAYYMADAMIEQGRPPND